MSDAFEANAAGLPFAFDNPFTEGPSGPDWEEAGSALAAAARSWLGSSAAAEVSDLSQVGSRGLQIINLSKALDGLAGAYGSCAP